jgi:hypothetical protein
MDETLNHPGHELHGEGVEADLESFQTNCAVVH